MRIYYAPDPNPGGVVGTAGGVVSSGVSGIPVLGGLVAGGINALMQGATNKSQHDLVTQMYAQQRKDAIADWNMMNKYNSPVEQMQRFKDAGLNPNLIYGKGDSGNSAPVRASSPQSYNPTAPKIDAGALQSGLRDSLFYNLDVEQRRASIDNLVAQSEAQRQSAEVSKAAVREKDQGITESAARVSEIMARMPGHQWDIASKKLKFDLDSQLFNTNIQAAQIANRSALQQMDLNQGKFVLESLSTAASVNEAMSRIHRNAVLNANDEAELKNINQRFEKGLQEIENLKKSGKLMQLDLDNTPPGSLPKDSYPFRLFQGIGNWIQGLGRSTREGLQQWDQSIKNSSPWWYHKF